MIPRFHRAVCDLTAVRHNLPARSAPACLLPPNADIAMFAGRAAPSKRRASATGPNVPAALAISCALPHYLAMTLQSPLSPAADMLPH
jgi:hypothetical protein